MSDSRTVNSVKNIFTGFMSQGVIYIVGFINRMIFIRYLSAEYLGVNALFSNVLSLLSLAELGIGTAIVYALYKPLAKKDEVQIGKLMCFYAKAYQTIGCVVAIIGLSLIPFLKQLIGTTPNIKENIYILYLVALFNVVLSYFFTYKSSLLNADQKNYILTMVNSVITIVQCILQAIILIVSKNFILYLVCQSFCVLLYNLIVSYVTDKRYPIIKHNKNRKLDEETRRSLYINIKALMITKLSGVLVNSTDNIILTALKGLNLTGLTSNYVLLTSTLNGVLMTIFGGLTASIGNANVTMSKKDQNQLFYTVNFMNFWLYGWCTIAFFILANDIIQLFFGKEYLLSIDIIVIMAVNFYTVGMQNAIWTFYNTLGLFDHGKYLGLITGAINIALSIKLGMIWGLFGILIATFISRLLTNIWYSPYALFRYGLRIKMKQYFVKYCIYVGQVISVIIVIYIINHFVSDNIIVKFILCIFIPNLCFYLFNMKSIELEKLKEKFIWIIKK